MDRKYFKAIQKVFWGYLKVKTEFLYIGTGILKVCDNAKISHRRLQKVELGYQNAKKVKFYHSIQIVIKIQLGKKKKKKVLTF